jgi:hypothetical protein
MKIEISCGTVLPLFEGDFKITEYCFRTVGPVKLADTALVIGNHATIAGWRHGECPAFGGLLDEVKIFEKPLTAADVKAESEQVLPQE